MGMHVAVLLWQLYVLAGKNLAIIRASSSGTSVVGVGEGGKLPPQIVHLPPQTDADQTD